MDQTTDYGNVTTKRKTIVWKRMAKALFARIRIYNDGHEKEILELERENERLRSILDSPKIDNFFDAVKIEAAHQLERWKHHDPIKSDADWYWLIGYLAGKAMWNPGKEADEAKRLHRIITVAAAACNWYMTKTIDKLDNVAKM